MLIYNECMHASAIYEGRQYIHTLWVCCHNFHDLLTLFLWLHMYLLCLGVHHTSFSLFLYLFFLPIMYIYMLENLDSGVAADMWMDIICLFWGCCRKGIVFKFIINTMYYAWYWFPFWFSLALWNHIWSFVVFFSTKTTFIRANPCMEEYKYIHHLVNCNHAFLSI